jgi:pyrimidine-nucleoside phosphorylase
MKRETMDPVAIIEAKRDGRQLSSAEIDFVIRGYTRGDISDYQMTALLMAICFRGMDPDETLALTRSMITSGEKIEFRGLPALPVDKHSTGGVGDKITLSLVPLVAACGVPVPMLSGRSLRHSGGTLDKLESIPGFRTDLSLEEYRRGVESIGAVIMGQTEELAPADRKMYALRDATGTVPCLPLIIGSILSKKVAGGAKALVLDVKCGLGAFMPELEKARALGRSLKGTGVVLGLQVSGFITNMDQPIGRFVGNALEVREAIEVLQGQGPPDATELTLTLGAEMLLLGGVVSSREDGRQRIHQAIESGAGRQKLKDIIENQGGDPNVADNPDLLPRADKIHEFDSPETGFVAGWNARLVGLASMRLGAGRLHRAHTPDPAVGIELLRKVGDSVDKGETVARVHYRDRGRLNTALQLFSEAFSITPARPKPPPLIIEEI